MSDDGYRNHDWSFRTITNRNSHDILVGQCNRYNIPTVLHVYNSSVPRCQSFLTVFEEFAKRHDPVDETSIQYAKMDYTPETSFMFKFAPNQLPITVAMFGGKWARTVTGPEIGEIESMVTEMVKEYQAAGGVLPDG
ncbi:hypothetical protein E8E12_001795 [Didymella heteroderae]|uniref:Thioredoxin domain-containing protein n=1 Tax=Didymella heteroderae TaxID=1769908 RepID=A0A9P4WRC4_9PLEO|nr:hypothetical protein E8E12_001795 [Didymella heteroderae]